MNIVTKNHFKPKTTSFDDFFLKDFFNWSGWLNEVGNAPLVNIAEKDGEFVVEMAAPGLQKENFNIELENDSLKISANMVHSEDEENVHYSRKEFHYNSFSRSFHLPNTVESENIEASYKDGILKLIIPKKEEAKSKAPRTIHIS